MEGEAALHVGKARDVFGPFGLEFFRVNHSLGGPRERSPRKAITMMVSEPRSRIPPSTLSLRPLMKRADGNDGHDADDDAEDGEGGAERIIAQSVQGESDLILNFGARGFDKKSGGRGGDWFAGDGLSEWRPYIQLDSTPTERFDGIELGSL